MYLINILVGSVLQNITFYSFTLKCKLQSSHVCMFIKILKINNVYLTLFCSAKIEIQILVAEIDFIESKNSASINLLHSCVF